MIIRRFISFLLVVSLVISAGMFTASASGEGYRKTEIEVENKGNIYTEIVLYGDNGIVYVPVSWLTKYGLMDYKSEGNRYVFYNAGEEADKAFAKRIYIDKSGNKAQYGCIMPDGRFANAYTCNFSDAHITDNLLYLPITEILPLMNAKTEISEDGLVHINSNIVSFFSALYGIDLDELLFNASEEIYGSEFISATGMLIDSILDKRIDRLDGLFNSGEITDYEDLFMEMLDDDEIYLKSFDNIKTPTQLREEEKVENLKDVKDIVKDTTVFPKALAYMTSSELYPEFHDLKDIFKKMSDASEQIHKIAEYAHVYKNQLSDHRNMLAAVYGGENYYEANPACKAANTILHLYGDDFSKQIEGVLVENLKDYLIDEFNSEAIKSFGLTPYSLTISLVKIIKPDSVKVVGDAAKLKYFDEIVHDSKRVFNRKVRDMQFDEKTLNDLRLVAIMALISSRKAYETFWQGNEKKEELQNLSEILEMLYLASDSVKCENTGYYIEKRDELERNLGELKIYTSDNGVAMSTPTVLETNKISQEQRKLGMIAYAELLAKGVALKTPGDPNEPKTISASHYYLMDMDGDGMEELFVYGSWQEHWSFLLYTFKDETVSQIADSFNTCDISEWSNVSTKISVYDDCVLKAEVYKSTAAYSNGSSSILSYNGKKVSCSNNLASNKYSSETKLVHNSKCVGGIEIGSNVDELWKLYLAENNALESLPIYSEAYQGDGTYYYATTNNSFFDEDFVRVYIYGDTKPPSYWAEKKYETSFAKFFLTNAHGVNYAYIYSIQPMGNGRYNMSYYNPYTDKDENMYITDAEYAIRYAEEVTLYFDNSCKFFDDREGSENRRKISRDEAISIAYSEGAFFDVTLVIKNGKISELVIPYIA